MDAGEGVAGEFDSYEDYLDSQITDTDLYYLEDEELARQLVVSVHPAHEMLEQSPVDVWRELQLRVQRQADGGRCCECAPGASSVLTTRIRCPPSQRPQLPGRTAAAGNTSVVLPAARSPAFKCLRLILPPESSMQELGYRGSGETLKRNEFEERK
jgi:hypothetical protein